MVDRHYKVLVATMRITTNTTPTRWGTSEYWLTNLVVVIAAGKRPVSIPNLEAKPASADGTAPGRVWESRTPPQQPLKGGALGTHVPRAPPFTYTHKKNKKKGHPPGPVLQPKGRPLFLRKHFLLQHSTRQHTPRCKRTPRIRTQRCDYRKRARPSCNRTTSTPKRQHTPNVFLPVHSASVSLVAGSRCSSKRSFE